MKTPEKTTQDQGMASQRDWLVTVREQVNSLRFGVVQIVIHDSRVVQIEKTERVRLDKTNP
jgi:hypothetical protein